VKIDCNDDGVLKEPWRRKRTARDKSPRKMTNSTQTRNTKLKHNKKLAPGSSGPNGGSSKVTVMGGKIKIRWTPKVVLTSKYTDPFCLDK